VINFKFSYINLNLFVQTLVELILCNGNNTHDSNHLCDIEPSDEDV